MRIFIEPTEPLLFRTGRPFTAGESNFAESLFPPTPETIQGAVRAMLAIHWGASQVQPLHHPTDIFQQPALKLLIGDRSTYGRLRFAGITLGRKLNGQVERLFPAPAHIMRVSIGDEQEKENKELRYLRFEQQGGQKTNAPVQQQALLFPDLQGRETTGKSEELSGWLTPRGLKNVLHHDILPENDDYLVTSEKIYTRESRLGIGIDTSIKATKEGFLYQSQVIRMQDNYGFVVDLELGDAAFGRSEDPQRETRSDAGSALEFLPKEGWLTIGGEQRTAHFTVLQDEQCVKEEMANSSGRLLYFATPTYFKNGWLPEDMSVWPAPPLTAAIHRYQPIGGWSLDPQHAGGTIKLTRRCVPAGSVYFFEQPITVTQSLTEYGWQIGYGITYTGDWK